MKPSRRNGDERPFFDVRPHQKRGKFVGAFERLREREVVNLKPNFFRRNPAFITAAGVLFMLGIFIGNRVLTRAEVADFYPSTCLGTWQNVGNAAGPPENFNSAEAVAGFSDNNSAVYRDPKEQIFCGGFLAPDAETKGDVKRVALTLVWHVGE